MTAKILVLAGRRSAALDPLAKAAGVTHKCLVPVRGEAMVGRVLRTAADAWPDAELFLSVDDFSAVAEEPTVAPLHRSEEHTSELPSLMRISYAVITFKQKKK